MLIQVYTTYSIVNQEVLFYAGLKLAVFAALVPNSANKLLVEVAEEIMGDHEMMVYSQSLTIWI